MNTMRFKGCTARVDFDDRDRIFVGRVRGVREAIGFDGEAVSELRLDFRGAIEHCLSVCAKRGERPVRPRPGRLMLRIPPEAHASAALAAGPRGESLNPWATEVLRDAARP